MWVGFLVVDGCFGCLSMDVLVVDGGFGWLWMDWMLTGSGSKAGRPTRKKVTKELSPTNLQILGSKTGKKTLLPKIRRFTTQTS